MKTNLLLAGLFAGVSLTGFGQAKKSPQVPEVVKTAFAKQYPGATAKWEKEDGNYEAAFVNRNVKTSVLYNAGGKVEVTEVAIPVQELPKAAAAYISRKKLGTIGDAARITKAGGAVEYEAAIRGRAYIFDHNGNFLKEEKD